MMSVLCDVMVISFLAPGGAEDFLKEEEKEKKFQ